MIEELKNNIEIEFGMLKEIAKYSKRAEISKGNEKRLLNSTIKALKESIKIINDSIPRILFEVSAAKELPSPPSSEKKAKKEPIILRRKDHLERKEPLEKVSYTGAERNVEAVVHRKNRERLLKELSISEGYIKKLKKRSTKSGEEFEEFRGARGYLKLANGLFLNLAITLINKGYFKGLKGELRKANMDILFQTYVAMILLNTFLSIFAGFFLNVFLAFFSVSLEWPLITFYDSGYLLRFVKLLWLPVAVPIAVFLGSYYYPTTEKGSLGKRIERELPFAVIHMSAISGAGIQPSEIFRIIGLSNEYPYLRKEVRKILNQINLYGYDLVTALNNISQSTPSSNLSELLSGLGTTINSGGNLKDFFEKRADTLLQSYKIEREKYSKTAETFMDVYISVIIAAPMILMLMLVIMTVSNFNVGFSSLQMTFIIIAMIGLANMIFLVFLHINQPTY